jgi:hypothetical protein
MKRGMNGVIRRAQLIAPFGVGAMTILANGTSVIGAGLDHWFAKPEHSHLDMSEYVVQEWRLENRLRVGGFRLPPDDRSRASAGQDPVNVGLTVPFLRFPTWSFCSQASCKQLRRHELSLRDRPECDGPAHDDAKFRPLMVQVSFVAICEFGHIMDFPWREWAHSSGSPTCRGQLTLVSTGGGTLDGQRVTCECGAKRTLRDVTIATGDKSRLSSTLEPGQEFLCRGEQPWHGRNHYEDCGGQIRASLRGASNVYFAQVASSIFLPRHRPEVQQAINLLTDHDLNGKLSAAAQLGMPLSPEVVRKLAGAQSASLADGALKEALETVFGDPPEEGMEYEQSERDFRRPEYRLLREVNSDEALRITPVATSDYGDDLGHWLNRVTLVDRLRETRALWGFSRVHAAAPTKERGKGMLRAAAMDFADQWLPAYVVHGEGIYLEFDEDRLQHWESRPGVVDRIALLERHRLNGPRHDDEGKLAARLVLLHTFAHVLINQLVFDCGYSSAALRERLFVAEPPEPMSGILVYTASGDSEGTMGGLVRMGRPGRLEPVLRAARDNAAWCSSDPVCMELGGAGQGPESCNLAACHSCVLLPETACEKFNRFLDRGLLVGSTDDPSMGFFDPKA